MVAKIDRGTAVVIVLFSGLLFGTTGTARVLSDVEADSTSVAAARLSIGALGLVIVAIKQRGVSDLIKLWKRPRVWIMGTSVSAYMLSFFAAVSLAGAAVAALVSISLAPMLAGAFARAFGKPWPGKVWIISTTLAVVGVVLLSAPTSADIGSSRIAGALLATIASASYAFFTVVGAKLVDDEHHATDGLAASFSFGAVLLLPFLFMDSAWLFTGKGLALALWLGLASTTLSYVLFGIGITHLPPGVVATLLLSEPAIATLLGVFVLGEPMAGRGWFGCLLIVVGLIMVSINEQKKSQAKPI
jgi:DME family drug/metabolite transporter